MQWKFFSDEMPDTNEPLFVTYLDRGAEDAIDDPNMTDKGDWFHVAIGMCVAEGFGFAFYENGDKWPHYQHAALLQSGRWSYVHDLAKETVNDLRLIDDAVFLLVHESCRGRIDRG